MIVLYVLEGCPYCERALGMLNQEKIKYQKIVVQNDTEKQLYKRKCGMNTFPMIFNQVEEDKYIKIGGSTDLEELIRKCKEFSETNISIDNFYIMYKKMFSK